MRSRYLQSVVVLCVLAAAVSRAEAQERVNFTSPGARASGMGFAFVGVADDATAIIANPAGVVLLGRPQVYFELNFPYSSGADAGDAGLGFAAFSMPVGERLAIGVGRHEFLRFRFEDPDFGGFGLSGASYTGTIAASVSPTLRAGASVSWNVTSFEDDFFGDSSEGTTSFAGGVLWSATDMVTLGVTASGSADRNLYPAKFGAGLGVRVTPVTLLAADVVNFSQEGFSTTELHVGGEHQLMATDMGRLFVRGGALIVEGDAGGTVGAGLTMAQRLQLDAALKMLSGVEEFIVSAAIRF